jgi:hypothetical protein
MGMEIRKVAANWKHPEAPRGHTYHDGSPMTPPLFDGFKKRLADFEAEKAAWERGEFPSYASEENKGLTFEEWDGPRPEAKDYMPDWPPEERTHIQLYETVSEGTPLSPVCATPEELARYMAANPEWGRPASSYETWMAFITGPASAPSIAIVNGTMLTGPEAGLR